MKKEILVIDEHIPESLRLALKIKFDPIVLIQLEQAFKDFSDSKDIFEKQCKQYTLTKNSFNSVLENIDLKKEEPKDTNNYGWYRKFEKKERK